MVRLFKESDYETVVSWWQSRSWPVLPREFLPATGYVVEGICAGFLYQTDSKIAWLEFIISNPATSPDDRAKALDSLIQHAVEDAKLKGFKIVFTSTNHDKLIKRYEDNGFIVGDKGMTNLVRNV